MTILLMGLGGAAAALGTRLASLLFIGAAVAGALGTVLPAAATWTAALAAGLVRTGTSPRRLALPALGAAAVLAAASSSNSAAVLGLWVLGTASAFLSGRADPQGRRWALLLCIADLPLAAVVIRGAIVTGFESWPQDLGTFGLVGLLAAAFLRAPLISGAGPAGPEAGLLVVRAQAVTLVLLAANLGSAALTEGVAAAGAALFGLGGLMQRESTRDGVQEVGLVALAAATSALGWTPGGWEWGALAAGTLIHHLRVSALTGATGPLTSAVLRGAGFGLPFLPVVVAQLEGSLGERRWLAAAVAVGLLGGLGGRARSMTTDQLPARHKSGVLDQVLPTAWIVMAGGAALWSAVLALPEALGGQTVSWPPVWAVGVVAAAGMVGALFPRLAPERAPVSATVRTPPAPPGVAVALDRVAASRALEIGLGVLVVAGAGLWVAGLLRGFL